MQVTVSLGKTTYEVADDYGGIVTITRYNSDGPHVLRVPKGLLIKFVAELKRSQSTVQTDEQLLGLKP